MHKIMTIFTYKLLIISLLLSGCAAAQAAPEQVAPEAGPTLAATTTAEKPASKASTPVSGLPAQKGQDCSERSISEAVIAVPGNGTGRSTKATAIDPATGQQLCGYNPIELGGDAALRISPDHRYLASIDFRSGPGTSSKILFVDLTSWSTFIVRYPIMDWVSTMVFSRDASHLALAFSSGSSSNALRTFTLALVDVGKQAVVGETTLEFSPHFLQFTPDGRQLIAVGGAEHEPGDQASSNPETNAQGVVMDISDLKANSWAIPLQDIRDGSFWVTDGQDSTVQVYRSAVQLSPDGRYLYIAHASEDKLTSVDLKEKNVRTVDIHRKLSWFERLLSLGAGVAYAKQFNSTYKEALLSQDGKKLYVLSLAEKANDQGYTLTSQGLQAIDTSTGEEMARLDTAAVHMALAPGDQQLYLISYLEEIPWSDIVSVADLKVQDHLEGSLLHPVNRQNGNGVLLMSSREAKGTRMALLDPLTLRSPSQWIWSGLNFEVSMAAWPEY